MQTNRALLGTVVALGMSELFHVSRVGFESELTRSRSALILDWVGLTVDVR